MLAGRTLGVIGVGNMGTALIRGWLNAGLIKPNEIIIADRETDKVESLRREYGLQAADNRQVATQAEIVLLAVKPQVLPEVLAQLQSELDGSRLVISIAAGVPLSLMSDLLPDGPARAGHAQHSHPDPGRHGGGGQRSPG